MEYLNTVSSSLKTISEKNVNYMNVFETEGIMYGTPFWNITNNFLKYSRQTEKEISFFPETVQHEFDSLQYNASGCFLKFYTRSERVIVKAEIRRKYDYAKMTLWNSSGFDVYEVDQYGQYEHKTVFGPQTGKNIFAEQFGHNREKDICIYLPLYNEIKSLYIGAEDEIIPAKGNVNKPAILFYGNSITQGASASRSGNAFCNIVSRTLNNEVFNFSMSSCCRGLLSVAEIIGILNLRVIIIDYTRNANNHIEFENTYSKFYDAIRRYHKDTPVILMTTANFNHWKEYFLYERVVYETYEQAVKNGDKTFLLNQAELFNRNEYDLISLDGAHYTDGGMFRVAEKICNLIELVERQDYCLEIEKTKLFSCVQRGE